MISDEIIKIFDYLADKFGILIDWSSDQAMPYIESVCEKYIRYELVTSITRCILLLLLLVLSILLIKAERKGKIHTGGCVYAAFAVMIWACLVVIPVETDEIIKCITFPELQLYGFLSSTIKEIS